MKLTYKHRLFFWFFIIFFLSTVAIIYVEQQREKEYRTKALESKLDGYTEILHSYIERDSLTVSGIQRIDSLKMLFPDEMRVTVVTDEGTVIYDKDIANLSGLSNHLDRPEIMKALYQDYGTTIRESSSTGSEYLYYAKYFPRYFIRVALPYNIQVEHIIRPDGMFVYVALFIMLIGLLLLNIVAGRFGKSISKLKRIATDLKEGHPLPDNMQFPDDELGEISEELIEVFKQKEQHEQNLSMAREKLIRHFQFSNEGLCIFEADRTKIYANTRFMQYLNLIVDKLSLGADVIFTDKTFLPVQQFLEQNKQQGTNNFSYQINRNGKVLTVQTLVFEDGSFEISIMDMTEAEKTRILKQEMTSNIAHELRTPVTSLRAFLETLDTQKLPAEKQNQFIHRAYMQTVRLSNLLEDVSLIGKIEESSSQFTMEKINVTRVVNDVRIDLIDKLTNHKVKLNVLLKDKLEINGNYTLIYSVFRNLIDNSIDHAGNNISIFIDCYMEDKNYFYFSYYDTGTGLEEKHLNRIFERFYRADEGRTRDSGGSGLGLSIVRNAIKFHQGEIQAKNRKGAGLEFLFTLKK